MGEDQAVFLQKKGLNNVIGIGHSMGAHAMILPAERFRRLGSASDTYQGKYPYLPG